MENELDIILEQFADTEDTKGAEVVDTEETAESEDVQIQQEKTTAASELYEKLKKKDTTFELSEEDLSTGEDKIIEAWNNKIKDAAITEYEEKLPAHARAIAEAYNKAGGEIEEYPKYVQDLELLETYDLSQLDPEAQTKLYNQLSPEKDEEVKEATLATLLDKGKLVGKLEDLVAEAKTTLKATIDKIEENWQTSLNEAGEKFKTYSKSEEDILDKTESLYNISLDEKTKNEMLEIVKNKPNSKSTKNNIAPTSKLIKTLEEPENRVKLALLIQQGYFNKDSKIDLSATGSTQNAPNQESQSNTQDNENEDEFDASEVIDIINNL